MDASLPGAPRGGGSSFRSPSRSHFLHHFQVVFGPHFDALGFEQLALCLEPGDAPAQFLADGKQGGPQLFGGPSRIVWPGKSTPFWSVSVFSPVRGSKRDNRSISSPKNSTRNASSRPAGHNSTGVAAHAELARGQIQCRCAYIEDPRAAAGNGRASFLRRRGRGSPSPRNLPCLPMP